MSWESLKHVSEHLGQHNTFI